MESSASLDVLINNLIRQMIYQCGVQRTDTMRPSYIKESRRHASKAKFQIHQAGNLGNKLFVSIQEWCLAHLRSCKIITFVDIVSGLGLGLDWAISKRRKRRSRLELLSKPLSFPTSIKTTTYHASKEKKTTSFAL